MELIWTKEYEIDSTLVNSRKELGLHALLSLLQDMAWSHAEHLKIGYEDMRKEQLIWVLARQKLCIDIWPKWGQTIKIATWIKSEPGLLANRDFKIYLGEKTVGTCATVWLTLNASTRKPARVHFDSPQHVKGDENNDYHLDLEAPKIKTRDHLENQAKFQVRNSDLDVHQHVNNTRYALWIIDSVPLVTYSQYTLKEYTVNFLAETKMGEIITIQRSLPTIVAPGIHEIQFQGLREADSKIVFSAICKVAENRAI